MKDLCEQYIREKCERARNWSLEAARDEENGHHDSAANLLKGAKKELESAIREIDRYGTISTAGTIIAPIVDPTEDSAQSVPV